MLFTEALKILQRAPKEGQAYSAYLACGFTPLHLQTFLAAHLQQLLPERHVSVNVGSYGDVAGTLERMGTFAPDALAVAVEWPDLDPRLGYRSAGRWGAAALTDIVSVVGAMLDRLAGSIERVPRTIPVAISAPTLPLPPIFHAPGWQSAESEWRLRQLVADFASRLARRAGCTLVNPARLTAISPQENRYDLKSDLIAGLPYTIPHAAAVGESLAFLIAPPAPKKGLITDLDDTLWSGLAGEVGPEGVTWDLASHSQLHAVYQNLLSAFAEEGVLVGIASKNDPAVVRQALSREDLLIRAEQIFPVEAHWEPKSRSVARILKAWNIGADSVVFVDDSPMELAEVAAVHPGIETILFPKDDYSGAYAMFRRLRDLFGKQRLSGEDAFRLDSIRQASAFREAVVEGQASEAFLQQSDALIAFDFAPSPEDSRVLELVNKTNQFNLNGIRRTEADWAAGLTQPGAVAAAVSYQDKFGPLGKIAVLRGWTVAETLTIDTFVMSCRAFSRRIEYQCLKALLEYSGAREIAFQFSPTLKNSPLRDFLAALMGDAPAGVCRLTKEQFEKTCPPLYHRVAGAVAGSNTWKIQSQNA